MVNRFHIIFDEVCMLKTLNTKIKFLGYAKQNYQHSIAKCENKLSLTNYYSWLNLPENFVSKFNIIYPLKGDSNLGI